MLKTRVIGLWLAFLSYTLWGFLSLYWKLLAEVSSLHIFSYRIIFTLLTMSLYMLLARRFSHYRSEYQHLRQKPYGFFLLSLATCLIASNWLAYIYAIGSGQATAASLGYYINPLVSIVLAYFILKEKLSRGTLFALILALLGVSILVVDTGQLPFITLLLAVSFALYGLIKKQLHLAGDFSMFMEALLLLLPAVGYLLWSKEPHFFRYDLKTQLLLASSGLVTATPLLLFTEALKRASLTSVGFIQYINPTIQLFIAIFIFQEPISFGQWPGFILIWLAIWFFMLSQASRLRKK